MNDCCVCDGRKVVPIYPQRGSVRHRACTRCGLVRQADPPEADSLEEHYDHGYFEARSKDAVAEPSERDHCVLAWLASHVGPGRTVVEIGIGWGGTLTLLQATGADVVGVEPSARQATGVGDALGVVVHHGVWETAPIVGPVDAIVMCHVLEHFRDPGFALDKARSVIADDGVLFIEVPNMAGPNGRKRLGPWLTREHLWYFTPATLEALLARHGFEVTRDERGGFVRVLATPAASVPAGASARRRHRVPHDLPRVVAGVLWHEIRYWPPAIVQRVARAGHDARSTRSER